MKVVLEEESEQSNVDVEGFKVKVLFLRLRMLWTDVLVWYLWRIMVMVYFEGGVDVEIGDFDQELLVNVEEVVLGELFVLWEVEEVFVLVPLMFGLVIMLVYIFVGLVVAKYKLK